MLQKRPPVKILVCSRIQSAISDNPFYIRHKPGTKEMLSAAETIKALCYGIACWKSASTSPITDVVIGLRTYWWKREQAFGIVLSRAMMMWLERRIAKKARNGCWWHPDYNLPCPTFNHNKVIYAWKSELLLRSISQSFCLVMCLVQGTSPRIVPAML